ncbi:EAL domain-containing protein [uncultured Sphingomonas sp.]|uniref:putative bifunctional diguanylate cyclase/phosphodiesterase n=1 Tax=uncultured Sphingomonas sp. TaxID=158754 RepID=UPI00260CFF3F|nr:EAL domain-containing protein [uncultured Sphingomonas sp.]
MARLFRHGATTSSGSLGTTDRADSLRMRWCAVAVAVLISIASVLWGSGTGIESAARTLRDGWRTHPASGDVIVVEIDAKSVRALNHWPWPRGLYATAIDRLQADSARSIGFDIDFSSPSQPAEDERFAAALRRAGGSVILPTFRQRADAQGEAWIESLPIPSLRPFAFLAAVNVMPDVDGVVRHYPLGISSAGAPRPSIAAMLAETDAGTGRSFPIDYAIDPTTITRVSFVDLVTGRVPRAQIAGKRVLIGATAIELGDRYPVPGRGILPGVIVQALATETLIQKGICVSLGSWPLAAAAILIVFLLTRARDERIWLAAMSALALSLPIVPMPFAGAGFEIDMVPALFATLGALAAGVAMIVYAELHHRRFVDLESGLPNALALEHAARDLASIDLTVARFDRLTEMTAAVGSAVSAQALRQIAHRLEATLKTAIYRIDDSSLAWPSAGGKLDDEDGHYIGLGAILRSPVVVNDLSLDASPTFGVASGDGREASKLAAGATIAAKRIRATGGRWDRYVDGDSDVRLWKLSLLSEFAAALGSGDIWIAYQPKYDVTLGRITATEALIRWRHPSRGAIPPDSFIPLIEEEGRAAELTAFVLNQALQDVAAWQRQGLSIGVAVNLSATLLGDASLVPMVRSALERHAVQPAMLTLELTESAVIADAEAASGALSGLKALGLKLSIDDYGTGQSTLGYLKRVPASELKIDKSFVQGVVSNSGDRLLVQSTIELAHAKGMTVVAEGVEDQACFDMLASMNCDTIQGWFTGKPMAAADFAMQLREIAQAA